MAPQGLLAVFTEPGSNVDEAEYHDWYDNEHVPDRLNVPTFLSWTRWEAVDGQTPKFLATYDMETPDGAKHPSYTSLFEKQSDREKRLFKTMDLMDRRVYTAYEGPSVPPSSLYDPKKPGPFISWVDIEPVDEAELNKWYDGEHIPLLAKVPGWIRSRRFVLKEGNQLGASVTEQKTPLKYIAIHEWASPEVANTPEMKAALETPQTKKILGESRHVMRVLRQLKNWEKN